MMGPDLLPGPHWACFERVEDQIHGMTSSKDSRALQIEGSEHDWI